MKYDLNTLDFTIDTLGERNIKSPLILSSIDNDYIANYRSEDEKIVYQIEVNKNETSVSVNPKHLIERAGPYEKIYFKPENVHAAIVTCGGLCPGLNDVIRSLVMGLWYRYNVTKISGVQFGYRGFLPEFNLPFIPLTPDKVLHCHEQGGTILGSSRGYGDHMEEIADRLEAEGVNMLFPIGGDGTQKGALDIYEVLKKRGSKISVVGVPKTIDNDLSFCEKSFGFETAVESADHAVAGGHIEAAGAPNGVAIVKVMGRESGYIAAHAALANRDVNFVLIPEVPFELEGENGLLNHLKMRLNRRGHAVILVAEGAGQDLLETAKSTDASGNKALGDIGLYLTDQVKKHFKQINQEINLKYIDPSYIIRSEPANSNDSLYCARLGTAAVHAAMAGKTGLLISMLHHHYVHIPIKMATSKRNNIDPDRSLWRDVLDATGQPILMTNS